jgi:hypothetical protein
LKTEELVRLYGQAVDMIVDTTGGMPSVFGLPIPFLPEPKSFVRDWARKHPDQAEKVAFQMADLLEQYQNAGLLRR